MDLTLADNYYLKALDNYPYNLEGAMENLNYALSTDHEHAQSLCLMGMVHMYQLKDYSRAVACFQKALESDLDYCDTYKHFALLKIWLADYSGAYTLIRFGLTIKGMDTIALKMILSHMHESKGDMNIAKLLLDQVKWMCIDQTKIEQIDEHLKRVDMKLKMLKKKNQLTKVDLEYDHDED